MKCEKLYLLLLCVIAGALFLNINTVAATVQDIPLATLYTASDFQNSEGHEQGTAELEKIVDQIYGDGNQVISEALICGDYYYDEEFSAEESAKGIESIYKVLNNQWGLGYDEIYYVQGNHDPSDTSV